ncbi:uncharacterized protein LOC110465550 isoform X3 [Mizuhopecten yessoensis]|uniref:uncharacterized protein LOC110465550 isoform X3 n=1 Tax=Mizuhopecten yessoensis TaxID=6573 RepID=UPI000B45BC6F|nr:uncharacterized protein LOC110465550 isoform X3 [Mizuhopecten yessoensis]
MMISYRQLRRKTGFSVVDLADKGRHLKVLNPNTPVDLRKQIGQGKLFLIPKRDLRVPSNADSVIQREEQPAARPVATPEPPIGLLHPPSRELEEDHSIHLPD